MSRLSLNPAAFTEWLRERELTLYQLEFKREHSIRSHEIKRWLRGQRLNERTYHRLRTQIGVPESVFIRGSQAACCG